MPYSFGKLAEKKKGPLITNNYKRVIEVNKTEIFKKLKFTKHKVKHEKTKLTKMFYNNYKRVIEVSKNLNFQNLTN